MRIGIDLDGVVFNTEELWAVYSELYDCISLKRNSIVRPGEPRVQERYNWSDEETRNYFDRYVDISTFDLVPGAKEVIDLLRKDGHELIVITGRSNLWNGIEYGINKLNDSGIVFDDMLFNIKDKAATCINEKIDIMIDDNYNICRGLAENKIKTFYFQSIGRIHLENEYVKEVYNWGEIYRYISDYQKDNPDLQ